MKISFRLQRHIVRDVEIIEVWYGERFIATIYPPPETFGDVPAVTIVSKHLASASKLPGAGPGGLVVLFELSEDGDG